jgi:hypothetical protein
VTGLPQAPLLRPSRALPGIHVVCPPRWDGVATAYGLHHCGWKRTGIGRGEAEAVTAAYDEHRRDCAKKGEADEATDRGR